MPVGGHDGSRSARGIHRARLRMAGRHVCDRRKRDRRRCSVTGRDRHVADLDPRRVGGRDWWSIGLGRVHRAVECRLGAGRSRRARSRIRHELGRHSNPEGELGHEPVTRLRAAPAAREFARHSRCGRRPDVFRRCCCDRWRGRAAGRRRERHRRRWMGRRREQLRRGNRHAGAYGGDDHRATAGWRKRQRHRHERQRCGLASAGDAVTPEPGIAADTTRTAIDADAHAGGNPDSRTDGKPELLLRPPHRLRQRSRRSRRLVLSRTTRR
jgi:hypothetical protein